MIKETDTHILGKAAIWLGALFSVASIGIALLNLVYPNLVVLSVDISLAFMVSLFTLLTGYVYGRVEHLAAQQERILAQPVQGIEIFESSDELLVRLSDLTVGARFISTLNLSPPAGSTRPLDEYFEKVHAYLNREGPTPLVGFRSLAHLSDGAKAAWLADRMIQCADHGRFSQAVFDTDTNNIFPIGYHAIQKDNDCYVFFFPGVSLTGVMKSFMFKNVEVYDIMTDYFDFMWSRALVIHEGANTRKKGLDRLLSFAPHLGDTHMFTRLAERAT